MFYSNAPESLPTIGGTYYKEGIIYNSAFRSNGVRVFVHHADTSTNKTVRIAVIARNVGSSSGSVSISKYGDVAGVSASYYIKLGAESVRQYFTNSPLGSSYSMAVNEFSISPCSNR